MLNIVLFGPPGAGKGTQSEKLIARYHLTHLSTGDLFRKHIAEGTGLGRAAQRYMDEGNLVPDEVVIGMVKDKIVNTPDSQGFIFDGFPRTVAQAEALDAFMNANGDDQDPEKIRNRFAVYQRETTPVAEYYKKQGKYHEINGVGSIEEIFNQLSSSGRSCTCAIASM